MTTINNTATLALQSATATAAAAKSSGALDQFSEQSDAE